MNNGRQAFDWNDEQIDEFRRLHEDPQWSYSDMARMLQTKFGGKLTRNSTIGKASRLHFPKRRRNKDDETRPRGRPRRGPDYNLIHRATASKAATKPAPMKFTTDRDIPHEQRRTLAELTNWTCRWPVGEPSTPGFYFCGHLSADCADGRVYCAHHARIAYRRDVRFRQAAE
jgi:GcrA cell cycle regulator